jgi:hypothetical protein
MAKITLNPVASGYNVSNINSNFDALVEELQSKVLYRDNPTGEPNSMSQDMDMNSNTIYNLPNAVAPSQAVPLSQVQAIVGLNPETGVTAIEESLTATASQTIFDLASSYTPGTTAIGVYVNGVRQNNGVDFVESGPAQISFNAPLDAGDVVTTIINDISSASASGGGGSTQSNIVQTAHGFSVMEVVRWDDVGATWVLAQADDELTLGQGVVVQVLDVDTFTLAMAGRFEIPTHGLTVGSWHYLSSGVAGALTDTEPTLSQPLVFAETADLVAVYPYRPIAAFNNQDSDVQFQNTYGITFQDAGAIYLSPTDGGRVFMDSDDILYIDNYTGSEMQFRGASQTTLFGYDTTQGQFYTGSSEAPIALSKYALAVRETSGQTYIGVDNNTARVEIGITAGDQGSVATNTNHPLLLGTNATARWTIQSDGDLIPSTTNVYDIGSLTVYPVDIYSFNALTTTSGREEKQDIYPMNSFSAGVFINTLQPVEYTWREGDDTATHWGFIADEVADSLDYAGYDKDNLGVYINKEGVEKIRYTEMIPALVMVIQELSKRVVKLEMQT